jgi:cytochrome P450
VWVSYGAANCDPDLFDEPEKLQCPSGNARQHLTFGYDAHHCVGPLLARLQLRETVTRVAKRFPEMRLMPDAIVPEIPHHGLRAPLALPVLLK